MEEGKNVVQLFGKKPPKGTAKGRQVRAELAQKLVFLVLYELSPTEVHRLMDEVGARTPPLLRPPKR